MNRRIDIRLHVAHGFIVQLTTDGHKAYLEAVEGAFGGERSAQNGLRYAPIL